MVPIGVRVYALPPSKTIIVRELPSAVVLFRYPRDLPDIPELLKTGGMESWNRARTHGFLAIYIHLYVNGERQRERKRDIQRVWDKCFFLIVAISARMKPAVGGVNVPCIYTRMPRGIYCWRIRSLLLCLCEVFRALINSLVRWFHTGALGHVLLQILAVCFCPNGLYWNVRWWNLFSLFQPSAVRVSLLFLSKWLTFSFLFFFPVEELIMLYTTGCLGMYAAWFFIIVVVVFESVPSSSFLPPLHRPSSSASTPSLSWSSQRDYVIRLNHHHKEIMSSEWIIIIKRLWHKLDALLYYA